MVDPNEKIAMDPFPIFQNGLHLKIHQKKQQKNSVRISNVFISCTA
jgi:hypothetical protein